MTKIRNVNFFQNHLYEIFFENECLINLNIKLKRHFVWQNKTIKKHFIDLRTNRIIRISAYPDKRIFTALILKKLIMPKYHVNIIYQKVS